MKKYRLFYNAAAFVAGAGLFWAFLPHAFHGRLGFTESSHWTHVIWGVVFFLIGIAGLLLTAKKA